jgi:hypothetical protein
MSEAAHPWSTHHERVDRLRGRYPFAGELLGLHDALLDVWVDAWAAARAASPAPTDVPQWTVEQVLPGVAKATAAAGPPPLAAAVLAGGDETGVFARWLTGAEVSAVEEYLARACLRPVLVALEDQVGDVCAADPAPRGGRHCPRCGGLPQLSFRAASTEPLVNAGRRLACARCEHTWSYSASACPGCGETTGAKRTLFAEPRRSPGAATADEGEGPIFPHIRIESCASCSRFLLDVELALDPAAVPEVDELAAVPLALYAADQGLTKITPNLMGL